MIKNLAFLLLVSFLSAREEGLYQKVIHNTDAEAKCLDGSPGLIYVHEGGDPKNILIFMLGGGFCG